ncbi:MAG TPA: 5-oxoprolinase subunit PxpA [Fimbriiglobus sp.]|nr:5-oxoprolinase subunit PxpA [Fimbriiglobus sp.]
MDIDLNADLGEGAGTDAELMPLVTSANVCCGLHAGTFTGIMDTLSDAWARGVVIGAHPGYPDREHYGRREWPVPNPEITWACEYQIAGLIRLAETVKLNNLRNGEDESVVRYIKPHGALYNQACRDSWVAGTLSAVAWTFNLPVVGLPGSYLEELCRSRGHPFIPEGFADRRYRPDGSLVPRTEPDAFVHDPDEAVKQVEWLIREKGVRTVCVHGDNPEAVAFARAVREALLARGFELKPFA